jgi:hypothetical protein
LTATITLIVLPIGWRDSSQKLLPNGILETLGAFGGSFAAPCKSLLAPRLRHQTCIDMGHMVVAGKCD